ncbi:hypothetical protein CXR24_07810 [Brevibacterium aurantiacum]|nr:hypothetical protein CXR24_07810 [Brevibacterium aurantiacum]
MAPAHAIDGPDAHDHATKQLAPELTIDGPQQDGYSVTFRTDIIGPAPLTEADAKAFGWLDVQQIRNPEPGL